MGSKSVEKRVRQSEKRRIINKAIRSTTRTYIKRAEQSIQSGELDKAKETVTISIASLDRAAEKGVIHPNNAARRKSRLVKKLNKALQIPEATTE